MKMKILTTTMGQALEGLATMGVQSVLINMGSKECLTTTLTTFLTPTLSKRMRKIYPV